MPLQREVSGKKINQINPEDNSQQVLVCCSSTRTVGYQVKPGGLKQMAEDGFHTVRKEVVETLAAARCGC